MSFFNKDKAFGMPAGTVRASIALILVGALVYALLFAELSGEELAILVGLASGAVAWYFAKPSDRLEP